MEAFQAYASDGSSVVRSTAREAAAAFFEMNPGKRKCNVTEGTLDGHFFTVCLGRKANGDRRQRWTDVTKKAAQDLPGAAALFP